MTTEQLQSYKDWYKAYIRSFYTSDADEQNNILLKEKHSFNVCKNIRDIAKSLDLDDEQINLAEATALFHDIGRFEQLKRYKTFRDSISINHGMFGADILSEIKILKRLPEKEMQIILQSVKYHNALKMPDIKDDDFILHLRLIRDADKLDIWRIFKSYFLDKQDMGSAAGLGLPDTFGYNSNLLQSIYSKKIIALSEIANRNDFKIMMISWVFDLNFKFSFELFKDRRYIEILSSITQTDEISNAADFMLKYIEQRINNGQGIFYRCRTWRSRTYNCER